LTTGGCTGVNNREIISCLKGAFRGGEPCLRQPLLGDFRPDPKNYRERGTPTVVKTLSGVGELVALPSMIN